MNNLKVIITGDFCPYKKVEHAFLKSDYKKIYGGFENISSKCDLAITNIECPLTLSKNPIKKTGPNLKSHPDCIEGIKFGGFNVVTLANNHIMDYGERGLQNTINICNQNNLKFVGAGKNLKDASKSLYLNLRGHKISIVNFCESEFSIADKNQYGANPLDPIQNYYQIKQARIKSDFIIVVVHGGHEHYEYPSSRVVKTYRFFADCGVNLVVGHHTHIPSGYEIYNDVPIFYSLGNFLFDWENRSESWYKGFFITFEINQNNKINNLSLHPYYQCKNELKLEILKNNEKDIFIKNIEKISKQIQDSNYLNEQFCKMCNERKVMYFSNLLFLNKFKRQLIKNNKLAELLTNKNRLRELLNIIRCESHRDCLINILENCLKK